MGSAQSNEIIFDSEKYGDRDPLVSSLARRNTRKETRYTYDELYKKMTDISEKFPAHLQKCVDVHRYKPWLNKEVKLTLIAYPEMEVHPPQNVKSLFTNIPFLSVANPVERSSVEENGYRYVWYVPSEKFWRAHCLIHHEKNNKITCNSEELIRTFTDDGGNSFSFYCGVLFKDNTFRILDRHDYKRECEWWSENMTKSGNFETQKIMMKSTHINSKEGKKAMVMISEIISKVFDKPGEIENINAAFLKHIVSRGKTTIYDYVECVYRILIFIQPLSPLYKYTSIFRNRIISGKYNNDVIPSLTIDDMFPEYYASKLKGIDVEPIKMWATKYLQNEIDDFFTLLTSYSNSTMKRPRLHREQQVLDVPVDFSNIRNASSYCSNSVTDENNIVYYKDTDDTIFCIDIDVLKNRTSNTNPIDSSRTLRQSFLKRFDATFGK
jgi:hypothetical protein